MPSKGNVIKLLTISICLLFNRCIEPVEPQAIVEFENILVIDATITDELKQQKIVLSRTFRFEDESSGPENNAKVTIVEDGQNQIQFQETLPGTYISDSEFAAVPNRSYRLEITTGNGSTYVSDEIQLPAVSEIDSLYAERITTDLGEDGMAIFLDTSNPMNSSRFYRYEYEETYKIFAPRFMNKDLILNEQNQLELGPRSSDEFICYPSDVSKRIILNDTEGQQEDRVIRYMVRLVDRNNYIIRHRYSILVKQFVQSEAAFRFYETLDEFSSLESIFSNTQPGFLLGNVTSVENPDEKVLGYFDISSVSQKRLFFNFIDFYPGERLPPYPDPCMDSAPAAGLRDLVSQNLVKYIKENDGEIPGGPYIIVPRVCGDCTALGSPVVPEFWID